MAGDDRYRLERFAYRQRQLGGALQGAGGVGARAFGGGAECLPIDAGGAEHHCPTLLTARDQQVHAVGLAYRLQVAAGKQRGEAAGDAVAALEPSGASAPGAGAVERQRHPGGAGELSQCFGQRARCNVVAAGLLVSRRCGDCTAHAGAQRSQGQVHRQCQC